ncbi:MAG: hypothetical protein O3C40_36580 [Planctomycetota bacterium]|nr:hypothetical protein [Planctomycetota bacterium]
MERPFTQSISRRWFLHAGLLACMAAGLSQVMRLRAVAEESGAKRDDTAVILGKKRTPDPGLTAQSRVSVRRSSAESLGDFRYGANPKRPSYERIPARIVQRTSSPSDG